MERQRDRTSAICCDYYSNISLEIVKRPPRQRLSFIFLNFLFAYTLIFNQRKKERKEGRKKEIKKEIKKERKKEKKEKC